MLAYVLPRVLAAVPRVDQIVSHLQEDNWGNRSEEGIPIDYNYSVFTNTVAFCLLSMLQLHRYLAVELCHERHVAISAR